MEFDGIFGTIIKWWGLILIILIGVVNYFDWIKIPEKFPMLILIPLIVAVWVLTTFAMKKIADKEQNYIESANIFDNAVNELNELYSNRGGGIDWKEISKVIDYGVHGTKSNKVWKMVYKKDGLTHIGKVDPKVSGKDSIVFLGKDVATFQPTTMKSDADLESISRELERLKDIIKYRKGSPKKTKIKLEQTEEQVPEIIEKEE